MQIVGSRAVALVVVACVSAAGARGDWPQWGGAQRDFAPACGKLAGAWPEGGPKKLWSRELGHGHSGILASGDRLYTMFRKSGKDVVACLSAATGDTIWTYEYECPMKPGMQLEFGEGPNSTPLLAGDRLFTVSATAILHAIDVKSGQPVWKRDLMEEHSASHVGRGFSCSPIASQDLVIVNAGGPETGFVAYRQDSGQLVWKSVALKGSHSSPILATIHGEEQIIATVGAERAGINPASGEIRWRLTADEQFMGVLATPLFIAPDRVFLSAAYGGGACVLKVSPKEDAYAVEQAWHNLAMKVHHGSIVRFGDLAIGSSGDFGPAFLMATQLADGKVAWRQRGFAKANLLLADGKLIILDEEGNLALATPSASGLTVHSQVKLLQEKAWTCPTLVGTTLYLRDYHTILALDLGDA